MSTYSTNLALELIGTGEQAGTWGNTTNTNLGTLIEQAISGYVTQAVSTGTDTTITIPNGATGVARNMFIELTGTGGTNTNLIVPANKKLYFIYNNASGAVTVKVSGQTGVSVAAGRKLILVSNGTDIVEATSYITSGGSISFDSLTVTTLSATSANITTLSATTGNITTVNATTVDATNVEVTNVKAKDGTAAITIADSTGNVGIGTASPGRQLTVYKASGDTVIKQESDNGGVFLEQDSTNGYWGINYAASGTNSAYVGSRGVNDIIAFYTGSGITERMRIDSSGNVGIGGTAGGNVKFQLLGSFPVLGGNANSNGIAVSLDVPNAITGNAYAFRMTSTIGASTALTSFYNYAGGGPSLGSGATLTNSYVFHADSPTTSTNNYGFYSNFASGSNRWNFYAAGTADNYFAGSVGFGTTSFTALYSGASTITLANVLSNSNADVLGLVCTVSGTGPYLDLCSVNSASNRYRYAAISMSPTTTTAGSESGAILFHTANAGGNIAERGRFTATGNLLVGTTTDVSGLSGVISDVAGNVRNIPSAGTAKTSAYTLTLTDIGDFVTVGSGGSITVPNNTFAAGNAVSIYNDTTGNISINCPITTAYLAGTNTDRASLTLATRGVATILFINPSLCVATGNLT